MKILKRSLKIFKSKETVQKKQNMRNEENIADIVYAITRILVTIFWNFKVF